MDMRHESIRGIIDSQGSKITSVEFIKKDGSARKMLVQSAATGRRCKGEEASERAQRAAATRAQNHPELLNIFDMDRAAIRCINMDTVYRITGSGQVLFEDAELARTVEAMEEAS